jgi:hypothetical protein
MMGDWKTFLAGGLRGHERTGRPLGGKSFLAGIETQLGRRFAKRKPGPKPKKSRDK